MRSVRVHKSSKMIPWCVSGGSWALVRFGNVVLEYRQSFIQQLLAPLGRFGTPSWRPLHNEGPIRLVFFYVFGAFGAITNNLKQIMYLSSTISQKLESTNNEKRWQNEGPIHPALLNSLQFPGTPFFWGGGEQVAISTFDVLAPLGWFVVPVRTPVDFEDLFKSHLVATIQHKKTEMLGSWGCLEKALCRNRKWMFSHFENV